MKGVKDCERKEVGGQNQYAGELGRPWGLARRQGRCPVRGGEAQGSEERTQKAWMPWDKGGVSK